MEVSERKARQKNETVVDTLPLLCKCCFPAAQLITAREECVSCVLGGCERARERERRAQKAVVFLMKEGPKPE